jgi:hypothetical protein
MIGVMVCRIGECFEWDYEGLMSAQGWWRGREFHASDLGQRNVGCVGTMFESSYKPSTSNQMFSDTKSRPVDRHKDLHLVLSMLTKQNHIIAMDIR